MDMSDYQAQAKKTAIYQQGIIYPAVGLASEVGELCGEVKRILRDDGGTLTEARKARLTAELGDVLWYVAALASDLGVDLGQVARANIDKLLSRQQRNVLTGEGGER